MTADIPTAYTHFADSWEFDGNTTFNNSVDQSVTIMAPQTNIEMGSYVDPAGNPSTLVGVVVAGNLDIRGSAIVDGSVLVTGAQLATNTTLGYFGTTDSGPARAPTPQPIAGDGQRLLWPSVFPIEPKPRHAQRNHHSRGRLSPGFHLSNPELILPAATGA